MKLITRDQPGRNWCRSCSKLADKIFHFFFASVGRSMYNYRAWLEHIQDWADAQADRFNRDDIAATTKYKDDVE